MARDVVYYYEKETKREKELGEIQTDFNKSYVLDQTKDSTKIVILSFNEKAIEPYTIIRHGEESDYRSWWVVSHDDVEKHANETGFLYIHTIKLLGAAELLNARDLTDSGFNQKTYTLEQSIRRLCKHSNLEYQGTYIQIDNGGLDLTMVVDYIKTYENYTLLSAIRELLNGYNCDVKIGFTTMTFGINKELTYIKLYIVSKTGIIDQAPLIADNVFKEIKEKRSIDKNSFGTSVVSNAENVISSNSKTYPTTGTAPLTGSSETIDPASAMLRLPSNIFKVNWLRFCGTIKYKIDIFEESYEDFHHSTEAQFSYGNNDFNKSELEKAINYVVNAASVSPQTKAFLFDKVNTFMETYKETLFDICNKASSFVLYNCDRWDRTNNTWVKPDYPEDFYFVNWTKQHTNTVPPTTIYSGELVLAPKDISDYTSATVKGFGSIHWERGKNYIESFQPLSPVDNVNDKSYISSYLYTDLRDATYDNSYEFVDEDFGTRQVGYTLKISLVPCANNNWTIRNTTFVINYIPMTDMKIKYDNSGETRDVQLYNQNGKLNDNIALSKLLLSHSKEIATDNITRSGVYYKLSDVPKVGSIVDIGGVNYVINNESLNFQQNEDENGNVGYYILGEFTLSKSIAVKSLMTNPDTDIRSYGIPQNYNVSRKQLYRDFYELGHTSSGDNDYYMPLYKMLNLGNFYEDYQEHVAVMKIQYKEQYGGNPDSGVPQQDTWYYQLDTTTYKLKKAVYEIINFNDNNIIGYSALCVSTGFDITKLLSGMQAMANTPVSYVDDNGEFESISIALCTEEQITRIYQNYIENKEITPTRSLYNASVFIAPEVYEGSTTGSNTILYGGNTVIENEDVFPTQYIDIESITRIDITEHLKGFNGATSHISIGNLQLLHNNTQLVNGTDYQYYIVKNGQKYYIDIHYYTGYSYIGEMCSIVYGLITLDILIGAKDYNDFVIEEEDYNKDALEVPVFEYSCQIDDSEDVIVGDNILDGSDNDHCFMYGCAFVNKGYATQYNYKQYLPRPIVTLVQQNLPKITVSNANVFEISERELKISILETQDYNDYTKNITNGTSITLTNQWANKDIVIVKYLINPDTSTWDIIDNVKYLRAQTDLAFIIRNTEDIVVEDNKIVLKINHYKLY